MTDFDYWWKKTQASKYTNLSGIMQEAFKDIARSAWDEAKINEKKLLEVVEEAANHGYNLQDLRRITIMALDVLADIHKREA